MLRNSFDLSVYLITDRGVAGKRGRTVEETVLDALRGGATMIQIREKEMTMDELAGLSSVVLPLARSASVPLIVNDNVRAMLAVDADGIHVGQGDMSADRVRRIIGNDKILGVSVYSAEEALKAEAAGADYVSIGPVGKTKTKKDAHPPIGLKQLAAIASVVSVPIVAVGGIVHNNAVAVVRSGIDGVAVISAIIDQPDPAEATKQLRDIVHGARQRAGRGIIRL